ERGAVGAQLLLQGLLAREDLLQLGAVALGLELARALPRQSGAASVLRRAEPVLRRQAYRQVPPADLFGPDGTIPEARLDALLLVTSHDQADVVVEPVPGAVVAAMMRASLLEERSAFLAHYRQFRFAFPDRSSDVVERAEAIEAELLRSLFAGRDAYQLKHPYPFDLDALTRPVASVLQHTISGGPPTDTAPPEDDHDHTPSDGAPPTRRRGSPPPPTAAPGHSPAGGRDDRGADRDRHGDGRGR
ncbi:MAG: hypothetical protein ACRDWY_15065, partial [Actinomycetes bacterium]